MDLGVSLASAAVPSARVRVRGPLERGPAHRGVESACRAQSLTRQPRPSRLPRRRAEVESASRRALFEFSLSAGLDKPALTVSAAPVVGSFETEGTVVFFGEEASQAGGVL